MLTFVVSWCLLFFSAFRTKNVLLRTFSRLSIWILSSLYDIWLKCTHICLRRRDLVYFYLIIWMHIYTIKPIKEQRRRDLVQYTNLDLFFPYIPVFMSTLFFFTLLRSLTHRRYKIVPVNVSFFCIFFSWWWIKVNFFFEGIGIDICYIN